MPIIWRYLIFQFFTVTSFCIIAFIAILLTMRLDEVAHFAALGAPLSYILLFTLYQIPYILPIAIPISCLIASLILIQRLSNTHELTALRATGFALKDIFTPILFCAAFFALLNFWIVSEVATKSHFTTNQLKSELRAINPLLLLSNKHLMRLKGIYFEAMGPSRVGEFASDAILAVPNTSQERLNLMIAKTLKTAPNVFIGQGVTLLSMPEVTADSFDGLLIENIEESVTEVNDLSQLLQNKVVTINNDYLKMSLLLARIKDRKHALTEAKDPIQAKQIKSQINRSYADIMRRLSIALAVFSFTLMGMTFGINISRRKRHLGLYFAMILTVMYLVCFFIAKGSEENLALATTLYTVPHLIIIFSSLLALNRVTKGIE